MNAPQEITLAVNQQRLVKGLRHSFTNKTNVLRELLQNGDRAGATHIQVDVRPAGGSALTWVFDDDGCGVKDMASLLTIATSEWSEEVMLERLPYGVGFLSALYSAKSIEIESLGKRMAFLCDDVLNFQPVHVLPHPESLHRPGTRLVLHGVAMDEKTVVDALGQLVQGFPVRVTLNGKELQRPYVIHEGYTPHAIGQIDVPGLITGNIHASLKVFLQGFLVYHSNHYLRLNETVVHLDPRQFIARLPDRDVLIDEATRLKEIHAAIAEIWQAHLNAEMQRLPAGDFIDQYLPAICQYAVGLLEQIDLFPRQWLKRFDDHPIQVGEHDSTDYLSPYPEHLTRADLEHGRFKLVEGDEPYDDNIAVWQYAYHAGYLIVDDSSRPADYWADACIQSLGNWSVDVEPSDIQAEGFVSGTCISGNVVICSAYSLRCLDKEAGHEIGQTDLITDSAMYDGTFYVPAGDASPGHVVAQASTFYDEHEYREEWYENDIAEIDRKVAELRGAMPSDILLNLIREKLYLNAYPSLKGKQFLITIDADGYVVSSGEVTATIDKPA